MADARRTRANAPDVVKAQGGLSLSLWFMGACGTDCIAVAEQSARAERLQRALDKPLRETILSVLRTMPLEAAPEHLAAMIESQVRAWQACDAERGSDG